MAQPRTRGQGEQSGGASSARNSAPSNTGSAQPARRFNLSRFVPLSRFIPSQVDRSTGGAAQDAPTKRTGTFAGVWKLVLTMAIILIAAPIGEYVILLIGKALKINYNQAIIGKGVPLFGGMTLFTFVYLVYIILIYVALFKFNIFPRDMFGARARAEARARERLAARNASTSSSARASRRAGRHAATTSSATPSARRVAANARAETQATITGEYDAEHARVKAAQRARRRRETRK